MTPTELGRTTCAVGPFHRSTGPFASAGMALDIAPWQQGGAPPIHGTRTTLTRTGRAVAWASPAASTHLAGNQAAHR
jgi:hypothetical protein